MKTLIKVDGKIVGVLYDSEIVVDIPENSETDVPLSEYLESTLSSNMMFDGLYNRHDVVFEVLNDGE